MSFQQERGPEFLKPANALSALYVIIFVSI